MNDQNRIVLPITEWIHYIVSSCLPIFFALLQKLSNVVLNLIRVVLNNECIFSFYLYKASVKIIGRLL